MERLWTPSENRRRLSSPAFIVTLVIAWFAIPILMGLVYAPLHSRWLIQETPRLWVAIAVAAVVWFSLAAIPLVFAGRMRPSLQELGGLLAAGALAGGFIASTG